MHSVIVDTTVHLNICTLKLIPEQHYMIFMTGFGGYKSLNQNRNVEHCMNYDA